MRFRLINDVGRDALVKGGFTKEEEVGVEKGKKKGKCYPRTDQNPPRLEGSRDPKHPEPWNNQGDQEITVLVVMLWLRVGLLRRRRWVWRKGRRRARNEGPVIS
jgi:hypothetical protein